MPPPAPETTADPPLFGAVQSPAVAEATIAAALAEKLPSRLPLFR